MHQVLFRYIPGTFKVLFKYFPGIEVKWIPEDLQGLPRPPVLLLLRLPLHSPPTLPIHLLLNHSFLLKIHLLLHHNLCSQNIFAIASQFFAQNSSALASRFFAQNTFALASQFFAQNTFALASELFAQNTSVLASQFSAQRDKIWQFLSHFKSATQFFAQKITICRDRCNFSAHLTRPIVSSTQADAAVGSSLCFFLASLNNFKEGQMERNYKTTPWDVVTLRQMIQVIFVCLLPEFLWVALINWWCCVVSKRTVDIGLLSDD